MIETIYIEQEIKHHPRTLKICKKFPNSRKILCNRFGEIFNRKSQNFLLQKDKPSLILAQKYGKLLYELPRCYTIGGRKNFYFSPLLNCPYNCLYCFLQGAHRSSHFVLFVNFEDFKKEIEKTGKNSYLFSGFDSDSLALNLITEFFEDFYPFFKTKKTHFFELRTKSINIVPLLQKKPLPNIIIAFSLNPQIIIKNFELKTPPLESRLKAIKNLQKKGWPIGLRFDPIIYFKGFEKSYLSFFQKILSAVDTDLIHSVCLGPFRLPKTYYKNMQKIGTSPLLLASLEEKDNKTFGYNQENYIVNFCQHILLKNFPKKKLFVQTTMQNSLNNKKI